MRGSFASLLLALTPCLAAEGPAAVPRPSKIKLSDAVRELSRVSGVPIVLSSHLGETLVERGTADSDIVSALDELTNPAGLSYAKAGGGYVIAEAPISASAPRPSLPATRHETEIIFVRGFRPALTNAAEAKKASNDIIETVLAEDIAEFPDLNLAESLQRLAGVAISREAGEGRRIFLRGLAPSFTRVQLNGMEVLANVDSPMDSRGQYGRDRAFDFNLFSSDLFARIDVEKTYSAEDEEGGIAGVVRLYTPKPMSLPDGTATLTAQGGTNDRAGGLATRVTGLISRHGERFGLLGSFSYGERQIREAGQNTYRWRIIEETGADLSALPDAQRNAVENGTLRFPRGNRLSVWQAHQRRLGLAAAAEWQPTDDHHLEADLLYGRFSADREEHHLASRGQASTWLAGPDMAAGIAVPPARILQIEANDAGDVVYLSAENATITSEARHQTTGNDFYQAVGRHRWRISDRASFDTLAGWERSAYAIPKDAKVYLEAFGAVTSDYRGDGFEPDHRYGLNVADPDPWRLHEVDLAAYEQTSTLVTIRSDATFTAGRNFDIVAGLSYRAFDNEGDRRTVLNLLRPELEEGTVNASVDGLTETFTDHPDQDWTVASLPRTLAARELDVLSILSAATPSWFALREETMAGYVKLEGEQNLGGARLHVDLGLRYFATGLSSSGLTNTGPAKVRRDYDGTLPTLVSTLRVGDNHVFRLGLSRNINRPPLQALALSGSLVESGGTITLVDVGNPYLNPYTVVTADLSYERHFGEGGYLAIGLFNKAIDDFIVTQTTLSVPFAQTGLPTTILPGLTGSTLVESFVRPINVSETDIQGAELSIQTDLGFITSGLSDVGIIANAAFVTGELDYATPAEREAGIQRIRPLEGLSTRSGNLTVYAETRDWGARVSLNHRSAYLSKATPTGTDDDRSGFADSTYVDASAHLRLGEKTKLTFDAVNLTNEAVDQYSDQSRRLYNRTTAGRSFYLGLRWSL